MSGLVGFSKTKQSSRNISQANDTWSGFYSYEIPSLLLINALRLEEFNFVKDRKDRQDNVGRIKLQIRGQEIPSYQPEDPRETSILTRNKTLYNNNIKKIREFLQQHHNFKLQIPEKVDVDKSIKDNIRKMLKLPESQPKPTFKEKQQDPAYYEQIILKTPTLFNRIISAYNKQKYEAAKASANQSLKKRKNVSQSRKSVPCPNEQSLNAKQQQNKMQLTKIAKFRQMNYIINLSNNIFISSKQDSTYKAYICKGNNGILVKTILKSRPWWALASATELQACNLVWTEWKRTKNFDNLRFSNPVIQRCQININKNSSVIGRLIRIDNYEKFNRVIQQQSQTVLNRRFNVTSYQNIINFSIKPQAVYTIQDPLKEQILNHLEGGLHLHSKKLLFRNLSRYYRQKNVDPFDYVPVTYLIRKGVVDPQFQAFCQHYQKIEQKSDRQRIHNIWICKPGQNSNRGNGIHVLCSMQEIKNLVLSRDGTERTLIIQKYIDYPFLYFKRKFDIRCFLLITTVNGILKAYWFDQGYIRTSSKQFSIKNIDNKLIHLTNDAIQKKGDDYGKYQGGNKVSFMDFQKYLDTQHVAEKLSVSEVFSKMKNIALDLVLSVEGIIHPKNRQFCFELFGLDFMIDSKFRPYLIQANSNPCLEVCGPVLGRLIPTLIENVIRIAIDPLFPPPKEIKKKLNNVTSIQTNKFELIYDETFEYRGYPITPDQIQDEPEYQNQPMTQ